MTSKQRAWLRGKANALDALLQVGKDGLGPETFRHADNLLRARELIKVSVMKGADQAPVELANALSEELGCEVVQVVGRKIVLYRFSKELHEKGRSLILPRA